MERHPHQPHGGDRHPEHPVVNSYGTDDPEAQARIEQARCDASEQRRRDRAHLEELVEQGMSPDDAEALIEFEHYVQDQREQTGRSGRAPENEPIPKYQPRIYITDLASQQRGRQHGVWLDANQSVDELNANIAAILDRSPTAHARTWTVHTSEDFAGLDVAGFTDVELISRLARGVTEHGAAYTAFVQVVAMDDQELLDRFDDFYVGSYDSPDAWAREVGQDLEWEAHLDQVIDPMLRPYLEINYARFAHDQSQVWDVVQGSDGRTHVFMR